jgi:hypothetical protein
VELLVRARAATAGVELDVYGTRHNFGPGDVSLKAVIRDYVREIILGVIALLSFVAGWIAVGRAWSATTSDDIGDKLVAAAVGGAIWWVITVIAMVGYVVYDALIDVHDAIERSNDRLDDDSPDES